MMCTVHFQSDFILLVALCGNLLSSVESSGQKINYTVTESKAGLRSVNLQTIDQLFP